MVAERLAGLPAGWTVLHDVRRPGQVRDTVDYVVLGPGGVFVMVVEPWTAVSGPRSRTLHTLSRRQQAAVRRAAASSDAVAGVLPGLGAQLVRPVLCLDTDQLVSTVSSGVLVCTAGNVVELLTTRSPVLTGHGVAQAASLLVRQLSSEGPVRRRAPSRAGRFLRAIGHLALWVGAIALVALVGLNLDTIGDRIRSVISASSQELGEPVSLPWSQAHPPVQATALQVAPVLLQEPATAGGRLVGVQLSIRNAGDRPLELDVDEAVVLRPELGQSWTADPVHAPVAGRRLLPRELRLPPGGSTTGWVVFAVAEEAQFDQVSLRFGPEPDDVARWTIDEAARVALG